VIFAAGEGFFPPISHLVEWKDLFGTSGLFAINKVVLLYFVAALLTLALFFIAGSKKKLVPKGVQNVAEAGYDFVETSIAKEVMGHHGKPFVPLLASLFFFIFFNNIFGVIPFIQMPTTARMALPAFLAILVWLVFNVAGIKAQGVGHYFKESLFPPGVPGALKPLVAVIELLSVFIVRPFSLAVRLFANVLAGHILLVTFAVLTDVIVKDFIPAAKPLAILPFFMLTFLTLFEIMVAFLQAYIFTILAAVYIGGAVHPEH
jgi:F-type H+-transporting ATPase subunit a